MGYPLLFSMLEEIIPRSCKIETITLQHSFSGESFKANLKAVDDVLIPGSIQAIDEIYSETGTLWKTQFPIFQTRAVEMLSESDNSRCVLIDEPTRVRIMGKELFFKAFQDPDDSSGVKEILTLEKIYKASLNQKQIRTSRLYRAVEDVKSRHWPLVPLHPVSRASEVFPPMGTPIVGPFVYK